MLYLIKIDQRQLYVSDLSEPKPRLRLSVASRLLDSAGSLPQEGGDLGVAGGAMEHPVREVPHLGMATLLTGMGPQSLWQGENLNKRLEQLSSKLESAPKAASLLVPYCLHEVDLA
jgi:hypothetical protein